MGRITADKPVAAKHSPGPWTMFSNSIGVGVSTPRSDVARCDGYDDMRHRDEVEANARLIAAAPDLLVACNEAFDFLGGVDGATDMRGTLLAAIAKAEGRQL